MTNYNVAPCMNPELGNNTVIISFKKTDKL